jgi:hypothetical protein
LRFLNDVIQDIFRQNQKWNNLECANIQKKVEVVIDTHIADKLITPYDVENHINANR